MPAYPADTATTQLSKNQLEYLLDNLPSSLLAVILGVIAIAVVFQGIISAAVFFGWITAAVLVILFRLAVYLHLKRNIKLAQNLSRAEKLIFLSATSTGLLWGTGTILFCIQTDMFYWVFLAFFMSGYASGAVFSTSALLPACAGYLFPTLLPITTWFFLQDDSRAPLMGALLLVFTFAAWNMAKNAHRFLIEKVEAQTQLQLAQQEIEANHEKVQALQTMAGGIAHDFNNILAGITGNLYLAQQENPLSPKLKRYLTTIETSLSQAGNISRKMLEYSNATLLKHERIDVAELLQQQVRYMQQESDIRIRCHIAGSLPAISGDIMQFKAVLDSLVFNAHESYATTAGDVSITAIRCDQAVLHDGQIWRPQHGHELVCIAVTDSGCGMSSETISHIFEPFFTTKFTGRGLGMSVVYGVIQRMGGKITIQSAINQGSTISIYLPVSKEQHSDEA